MAKTSRPAASPAVVRTRRAGADHQVLTLIGGGGKLYRRQPCPTCPWRTDAVGIFPAEAFRHSACTAHDMSEHRFGCHASGRTKPATCAGFLLFGADHNLSIRLARMRGVIQNDVSAGGAHLFSSYREMAVANGVSPDDPALRLCREPS
jgi:hypothetical protein